MKRLQEKSLRTEETKGRGEGDKERSLARTVASSRSSVLTMSVTSGVSTSNCRGSSDEASPPDTSRAWALCRGIVPSFFPESRPCACHNFRSDNQALGERCFLKCL